MASLGDLFEGALDRSGTERSAWLDRVCPDPRLRREVERMLAAHEGRRSGILDAPISGLAASLFAEEPVVESPGTFGPYVCDRELGRGGMGVVWLATDPRLERRVALKFLPSHLRADADAKRRFLAEARAASGLDDPNICTIYDIGETDGRVWIAMAYYDGETVAERLSRGPLPWREAVRIAREVARGLERAHETGIVHRDIKPSNIMLTARGGVKILDFGIAKLESEGATDRPLLGTVSYMAPEQIGGGAVDARADLWGVGVLLYEMVAGRRPFEGDSADSVTRAILTAVPPSIEGLVPVPAAVSAVIERALSKDREARFASAFELSAALEAVPDAGAGPYRGIQPGRAELPRPATTFIGREADLAALEALLDTARLITLTGAPGTGKTRLAIEAARRAANRFADGARFVSLEVVRDVAQVAGTIGSALGLPPAANRSPLELLLAALRDADLLLVLDNFEHLADAAPDVTRLLDACPGVTLMVTSRSLLRLSPERACPIRPFPVTRAVVPTAAEIERDDAVRLFLDRASAVRPEFELTDENAPDVAQICARLEGIPLAIELAAARIRLFTPKALSSRITRRLDVLTDGARDRPERQRTLRQAVQWSYDLLDEAERTWLRRLSVFVGGWTLEAGERVAGGAAGEAVSAITALVDHSLVQQAQDAAGEPRFTMLETIREFSAERLRDTAEADATRRLHAEYFLDFAETIEPCMTGPEQAVSIEALHAEHGNLRAALDWFEAHGDARSALRLAASLWRYWLVRSTLDDPVRRLERLLRLQGAADRSSVRARALHGLATFMHNLGRCERARELLEECLSIWRELRDEVGIAAALNNLSWVGCELADLEAAERLATEAMSVCERLGDRRGVALALNNLGWVATYRGDPGMAKQWHGRSLAIRREIGDRRGVAFALANRAWADVYAGNQAEARDALEEAEDIVRELDDRILISWVRLLFASLALRHGDLAGARERLAEDQAVWRDCDNLSITAWGLTLGAQLAALEGEVDEGRALALEARVIWSRLGTAWGQAWVSAALGDCALAADRTDEATLHFEEALRLAMMCGDRHREAEALDSLARTAASRSERERARELIDRADRIRDALGLALSDGGRALRDGIGPDPRS